MQRLLAPKDFRRWRKRANTVSIKHRRKFQLSRYDEDRWDTEKISVEASSSYSTTFSRALSLPCPSTFLNRKTLCDRSPDHRRSQ